MAQQTKVIVNGAALDAAMQEAKLEVKALEIQSGVTGQTIRNYLLSSHQSPRKCVLRIVEHLAKALRCDTQSLIIGATGSIQPRCYYKFACETGIADSASQRFPKVSGQWLVRAGLDAAFDDTRPWQLECVVDFHQDIDSHRPLPSVWFDAEVEQHEVKSRWLFDGCLTENGNVLVGSYRFVEESGNPKHGHVIAMCYADEMKGQFIGRNRKDGYGIVYGKFHATAVK